MDEVSGVIVIDKPKGVTSFDVVGKIRKLYNTKKVGHTGTLDPLATGVLTVLIGRSAKACEYLVCDDKEYVAEITLGISTDTEDITGKVISESDNLPSEKEFTDCLKKFIGKSEQIPPMYSALKVNGKKLCDLARQGIEVERAKREIEIYSIELLNAKEKEGIYEISVKCSKGTYIRTLCDDIGKSLGCGAVMSELRRIKSGGFGIELSHTISELEGLTYGERVGLLIPAGKLFENIPKVELDGFYARLCKNGCEIYEKKINADYGEGEYVRICDKGGFFALGQIKKYENGLAVKAVKFFRL